jgi:hypothetical protein
MSFGMGQLKYEIDKITRLTSSTKRLPLFAYLFQAMINEALDLNGKSEKADRQADLKKIKEFCEQESVQTMFIILYPLYKNLCMLTGRNPKDIAILLAKAIVDTSNAQAPSLKTDIGINLETTSGEQLSRVALSYMLQGRTTSARSTQILPTPAKFFEVLTKLNLSISESLNSDEKIEKAAANASDCVILLAIFMNMIALDKFSSSDDESRAANLVLEKAVVAFRDNGVYDLPEFNIVRAKFMKPRAA